MSAQYFTIHDMSILLGPEIWFAVFDPKSQNSATPRNCTASQTRADSVRPLCDIQVDENHCPLAAGFGCEADSYDGIQLCKYMDSSLHPDFSTNYQSPTGLSWALIIACCCGFAGFRAGSCGLRRAPFRRCFGPIPLSPGLFSLQLCHT